MEKQVIKCPHCGYEYLPAELYVKGSFFGKPINIIRDALGKIIYNEWEPEPDFTEKYICDGCDQQFVIEATVSYKSKKEEEKLDFKNQYVSLLD